MSQAIILNLQRFCLNDGPGIRTTVFFKGCPLHCVWCHNPESQNARKELFYSARSCIGCRKCAVVCPQNCHGFEGGLHLFNRKACTACGQCAAQCPAKALEMIGTERSTQEILSEALQDKTYYELSGGGITLSGGEPMMQFQAAYELLKQAKEAVLHTAMETCGAAPAEHFRQIAEVTDLFLYDYKETDPALHRERTGVSNRVILENLRFLDQLGANIILRCPIIPTLNDTQAHFAAILKTANSLPHVKEIHIAPYHTLGKEKCERLGLSEPLPEIQPPENATIADWIAQLQSGTNLPVKRV